MIRLVDESCSFLSNCRYILLYQQGLFQLYREQSFVLSSIGLISEMQDIFPTWCTQVDWKKYGYKSLCVHTLLIWFTRRFIIGDRSRNNLLHYTSQHDWQCSPTSYIMQQLSSLVWWNNIEPFSIRQMSMHQSILHCKIEQWMLIW